MDSEKITTKLNNIIIVKEASCMDGFLKLHLENVVMKLAIKTKHGMNLQEKNAAE